MSSILTNNGAMVALQTMKSINKNMGQVQSEISTGKSVGTARDNAAVWAISKTMESDVKGFKGISDSLALGSSTIAVARKAAETVTDLLTDIKGKVVAAQEANVDRSKIQTDIAALTDQIASVVGAAQFNGLNLLKGTESVDVLSSLDRSSGGAVTSSNISVARQDLSFDAGSYGTGTNLNANAVATMGGVVNTAITETLTLSGTVATGDVQRLKIGDDTVSFTVGATATTDAAADGLAAAINAAGLKGITAAFTTGGIVTLSSTRKFEDTALVFTGSATPAYTGDAALEARAETVTFSTSAPVSEGDGYRVTIGTQDFSYVAGPNESFEDVAKGLKIAIDGGALADIETNVKQDSSTGAWTLQVDNDGASLAFTATGAAGGKATGGLAGLDKVDVTTKEKASAALANIEALISTSIDAAAQFGSSQKRIDIQADFISSLSDSLKAGIGSLVDANMEEASARLQALQVQQQLATQSLSIANQAPQNILSLFR
ncbi:MAG: flagellin [Rhodobacteraceae bacterium]|nr:flagellin [Paracoccaceae bacterium]